MQINIEKELRIKQLLLIIFVMSAIFMVMTIYTIVWIRDYNHRYDNLIQIEAEVIEHECIDNINYDKLEYVINGNYYNITADWKSENNIGDKVVIYYDGDNPLGIIKHTEDNRSIILPIIASVFGVIVVALIVLYLFIYMANKKEKRLVGKIIDDNNEQNTNLASEENGTMQTEENQYIDDLNNENNQSNSEEVDENINK